MTTTPSRTSSRMWSRVSSRMPLRASSRAPLSIAVGALVGCLGACIEADTFSLTDGQAAAVRLERHYRRFAPRRLRRASRRAHADVGRLMGRAAPGPILIHVRARGPIAATVDRASGIDVNPDALVSFPDGTRGAVLHLALVREHVRIFQQRVLDWPENDPRRDAHAAEVLDRLARERGWELERTALQAPSPRPVAPARELPDESANAFLLLEDPAQREATLLLLRADPEPRALPLLRALLQDWDAPVRACAAARLADLGHPPRALVAFLDRGLRARTRPALRATLPRELVRHARGAFHKTCRMALLAGRDDPDAAVRHASRAALRLHALRLHPARLLETGETGG